MTQGVVLRPMAPEDVPEVVGISDRAFRDLARRRGRPEEPPASDEQIALSHARVEHLQRVDPGGAWVGQRDGRVVGAALALRRGRLWGLSLLVVDVDVQSAGTGKALLDAALDYGVGCDRFVIISSEDSRAMRRYALAGFDLHPQVYAEGPVHRAGLPAVQGVRDGSLDDVDLCEHVDLRVRGATRRPDLEPLVGGPWNLLVADTSRGRGYALMLGGTRVIAVAATEPQTAHDLLVEGLGRVPADKEAEVAYITAGQDWAISVVLAARLPLLPDGPVFWRGFGPPWPYLPSGAFL